VIIRLLLSGVNVIIDAHTHIFPDRVAGRALYKVISNMEGRLNAYTDGTMDGLLASMDAAHIDISIVLPVATSAGQGRGILEWIKKIPSTPRLIFFGSVHPEDPDYRDQIREMSAFGLQGLKFHPGYQNFPVDSKAAYAVYEEALKRGMVLYFHSGYDPSLPGCDFTSIERCATLAKDFKGSKIVLAHGGGYEEWDRVQELLGDKQCYFDVAFVLEQMKLHERALELYRLNEDYFLFGTDSPWCDQTQYVDLIRNSKVLTPEQKEKLFFRNVQKLIRF
jgi:predicted TIM-barrel fold metal-dependent hydrolase